MQSLTKVATTFVFIYKATTDNVSDNVITVEAFLNTEAITIPDKSLEIQKHTGK